MYNDYVVFWKYKIKDKFNYAKLIKKCNGCMVQQVANEEAVAALWPRADILEVDYYNIFMSFLPLGSRILVYMCFIATRVDFMNWCLSLKG